MPSNIYNRSMIPNGCPQSINNKSRYIIFMFVSAFVFVGFLFIAMNCLNQDRRLVIALNYLSQKSVMLDKLAYCIDRYYTFSGIVLMSVVWALILTQPNAVLKMRIALGVAISFCVGALSRFMQHTLPTHPRPYYDGGLNFVAPSSLEENLYNTWNSFPSDHATVFYGLAFAILLANRRVGLWSLFYITFVELFRIYMGAHYTSDIIGSAALAAFFQPVPYLLVPGNKKTNDFFDGLCLSPVFIAICWFSCFQIATLFTEVRQIAGGVFSPKTKTIERRIESWNN